MLYKIFCHNFWNEAIKEILDGRDREISDSPYGEIPILYPYFGYDAIIDNLKNILQESEESCVAVQYLYPELFSEVKLSNSKIVTSFKGNSSNLIRSLIGSSVGSCKFYFRDKEPIFEHFYIMKNEAYFIPSQKLEQSNLAFALKLKNEQKNELEQILKNIQNTSEYESFYEKKYLEIQSEFCYLDSIDEFESIKPIDSVKIDKVVLSLETLKKFLDKTDDLLESENNILQNLQSNKKFPKEPYSLKVDYHINLYPRFIPQHTKKDELQTRWEGIRDDYSKKLNQLESLCNELEEKSKESDKNLETFKNSKEQERKRIDNSIHELENKMSKKTEELNVHGEKFVFKKKQKEDSSSLTGILPSKNNSKQKEEVKYSQFSLNFPKEEPPKIGTLYNQDSKRFLAIELWEEYETAKEEAERLGANLCVIQ